MHRTNCIPCAPLGLLVLGLLLGGGAATVRAQEKAPATPPVPFPVAVNATRNYQLPDKQRIKRVVNQKENIAQVSQQPGDPRSVLITGVEPGVTKVTFTAEDDTLHVINVIVALDIELLENLVSRAVPTASVTPIPGAGSTIILTGTVAHQQDVATILGIAQSITGQGTDPANIINAMQVGGVMQVQLDVVVARVARSHDRFMSVDIFNLGQNHFLFSSPGNSLGLTQFPQTPANALPLIGSPNGRGFNLIGAIINERQSFFLFLQALRENGLAKLLSEPHLVTTSGRPAQLLSGGEQAVPTVSGFGGTAGVQFIQFGTQVEFLPIVLGNGKIFLEVDAVFSALDAASGTAVAGGFVPGRTRQSARTSVTLESGQTLAVGGLVQTSITASSSKYPVLGDLPFFGSLFTRKGYEETEEELIILVTPYLVDPMDCNQLPKYMPGQETRVVDDFEFFLENILEAPRGARDVFPNKRYRPAHVNSPTMNVFPCANFAGNGCQGAGCPGCAGCQGCGQQYNVPPPPPVVQPKEATYNIPGSPQVLPVNVESLEPVPSGFNR